MAKITQVMLLRMKSVIRSIVMCWDLPLVLAYASHDTRSRTPDFSLTRAGMLVP
jgi:hypothetical protein